MLALLRKSRLARVAKTSLQRAWPARPVQGLPPGLSREVLDRVCRAKLGQGLGHAAHVHLSSWKPHGTYRLHLTTADGQTWRPIFKDERYAAIPALEGLPIRPGPPELAIYRAGHPALQRFLPELHWCREVEPGRHFQYLIADIGDRFQPLGASRAELIRAVAVMAAVHAGLSETFVDGPDPYLIAYDQLHGQGLLDYVRRHLDAYQAARPVTAVEALCQAWPRIAALYQRDEFHQPDLAAPIHGDLNRSNLRVDGNTGEVRVFDWEWAGLGLPHADLASLLKRVEPADEQAALAAFIAANRQLDAATHQRLYRWSVLQRRLLDAGYIACQQLASTRRRPHLDRFVARAASDALRTADLLATAPGHLVA